MSSISREELKTIHCYEVAIQRPMSEQIVRKSKNRYSLTVTATPADVHTYSQQCEKYLEYIDRVKTFESQIGSPALGRTQLYISPTPQYLVNMGFEQLPILYGQAHFKNALHHPLEDVDPTIDYHDLTLTHMFQIPELLDYPLFISDSLTEPDSILLGLAQYEIHRKPLIAYIKPSGRGTHQTHTVRENQLATVFGRNNFQDFYERLHQQGKIIWENKMCRTPERIFQQQSLEDYPQLGTSDTSLRIPECIVNKYREGKLSVSTSIEQRILAQLNSPHPVTVSDIQNKLNSFLNTSPVTLHPVTPRPRQGRSK